MEPLKSNLEPIDEGDLNLEGKFKGAAPGASHPEAIPFSPEREKPVEIGAGEKDNAYGNILSKVQMQSQDFDLTTVASDAQTGAGLNDAETQIQHLVDVAQQKGVVHAVKVAQHMEDNYVLDTFHDRMLSEELHRALIAKGMIKEL